MSDSPLHFAVLRSQAEIDAARAELERRGLVETWAAGPGSLPARVVRRLTGRRDPARVNPDPIKAWDNLRTIDAVLAATGDDDRVLDVGSFASAILPALQRAGSRHLIGIDLDDDVENMPPAEGIEWTVGDLMKTSWADGSFGAITALSVIEHGVEEPALFAEVSRLLRPGGVFVFSTDYRPEKLDTSQTELFGLPWKIYSAQEIEALVALAAEYGLEPVAAIDGALAQESELPILFEGRQYTFLYGVLRRSA